MRKKDTIYALTLCVEGYPTCIRYTCFKVLIQETLFRRERGGAVVRTGTSRDDGMFSMSRKTHFTSPIWFGYSCRLNSKFSTEYHACELTSKRASSSLMYSLRTPRDLPMEARNIIASNSMRKGVSSKENANDITVHNDAILLTAESFERDASLPPSKEVHECGDTVATARVIFTNRFHTKGT